MNSNISKLLVALFLFVILQNGCSNDEFSSLDRDLNIIEMNSNGCKESLKSTNTERYIELKAEKGGQLRLDFINARLNCAGLDTTYAGIYDGILKVIFIDNPAADCVCDFDLECVIDGLTNKVYKLEVYAASEKPKAKITFTYSSRLNAKFDISDN